MNSHAKRFARKSILPVSLLLALAGLSACSSDHDGSPSAPPPVALTCDDSMKTAFKPDAATTVTLVKSFKKGDAILLSETATASTPIAANDMCLVKLNVGPGNPGPADAPSTSPGIGIEVWLPTTANWNNRIHVIGGGGWAGEQQRSLTAIGDASAATVAGVEGAVSATTDTGHVGGVFGGSFALNPDGTINTVLWKDFSERSLHEMAVKTKALTKAYYLKDARYAYWDGFSTGGRQGMKEAQAHPEDFDGILAGAPAMHWTKFQTSQLYMQLTQLRDLGANMTPAQLNLVSNAAINACDVVGGQHLGYIPDAAQCRYDPTTDSSVICTASGGINATPACVTPVQANVVNKMWYGLTPDGSVPSPAIDNGFAPTLSANQKWYGLTRGTSLLGLGGPSPFPISTDWVALELQNPTIGGPTLTNATGNGANGWRDLSYAQLSNAFDRGAALDPVFANINTDNPDLTKFRDRGAKLLSYHGLADPLIFPQGTINYYERVLAQMGGLSAVQNFYRLYLVPGMSHGFSNGTSNPEANVPLPTREQLYAALTDWVEKGTAPGTLTAQTGATASAPARSSPLCLYPQKAAYASGDPNQAASYTCR
jgi:feruloyl esterase